MLQFKTKKTNYLRLYIVIIMTLLQTHFECIFAIVQGKAPVSAEVQKMFLNAIEANDVEKVKLFLQNGASANYYNDDITWWDSNNNYRAGHGGSPRIAREKTDPLIHAILYQANDVVPLLIQYDRSVLYPRSVKNLLRSTGEYTTIYTVSPLQIAYGEKNEKMIELILQEIFNPTGGNPKLNGAIKKATLESSVLNDALAKGDWSMIEKLKGYGFKVAQGDLDKNLYNYIGLCSNYNYCKVLLEMGANPNYKNFIESVDGHPEVITPVLIQTARSGCIEMQKMLIEKGADINAIQSNRGIMNGYNSWNTLSINVQKEKNLEFITWLVEHGANLNPDLREGGRKKSILESSREEYKEFLVLHGAR